MATGVTYRGAVRKTENVEWSYSETKDKKTARGSYDDVFDNWRSRAPAIGSGHPDYGDLLLVKRTGDRKPGNLVTVTLDYEAEADEATTDPNDGDTKRYDLELTTTEEPILAHDRYKDLEAKERIALGNIANGTEFKEDDVSWEDDVTSDRGKECLEKIRKGITHFLAPGMVWVERFTAKNLDKVEANKCGDIMNPAGPAPSAGSLRNWLYIGATAPNSENGKTWAVERRWRLSAKGKWDAEIYGADAE